MSVSQTLSNQEPEVHSWAVVCAWCREGDFRSNQGRNSTWTQTNFAFAFTIPSYWEKSFASSSHSLVLLSSVFIICVHTFCASLFTRCSRSAHIGPSLGSVWNWMWRESNQKCEPSGERFHFSLLSPSALCSRLLLFVDSSHWYAGFNWPQVA